MENTFKTPEPAHFIKEGVQVSDAEQAMYTWIGLKLAHRQREAQKTWDEIDAENYRKLVRMNNIVTRTFGAAVIIAIIGLIIKNIA